jgi:hypothetical protein
MLFSLMRPTRAVWLAPLTAVILTLAACGHLTSPQDSQSVASGQATGVSGNLTCLAPSRPAPQGGCVTTDAATGISVRVTGAYTDVTGTLAHLVTANTYHYPLMLNGNLALRSGYVLRDVGGYSGSDDMIVDEPLPPQDFASHVEIIATATFGVPVYHGMYPPTLPPAPPWLNHLDHITIRVPFTLNPARAGRLLYHQPPTIEQGIGVQIQSLDYSPSHSAFFGQAGGARIEVRFTGLPADLELLSFIRIQSSRTIPNSDGGSGSSGDYGPGLFTLYIPGMTLGGAVMTLLQSPQWPTGGNQTSEEPHVGSAGTVQFEVAFLGGGTPTGAPATLTISGIQRLTGSMDPVTTANPPTLPTYQISLPMK